MRNQINYASKIGISNRGGSMLKFRVSSGRAEEDRMYTDPGAGLFLIQMAVGEIPDASYNSRKWIRTF